MNSQEVFNALGKMTKRLESIATGRQASRVSRFRHHCGLQCLCGSSHALLGWFVRHRCSLSCGNPCRRLMALRIRGAEMQIWPRLTYLSSMCQETANQLAPIL